MKKTGKRFISLLLAACMLLGTVPAFSVSAADGDEPGMTRAQLAVAVYQWFLPEAGNAEAVFNDLSDCSQEEKAAIETLAKAGIVQGTSEGVFSPQQTATRLEAAVAIFRTMGLAESDKKQNIFTDIPTGQEGAFNALVEQGILLSSDATDGAFLPSGSVSSETVSTWLSRTNVSWHFTRAQLAVMVCDVFDLSETGDASFDDIGDLDAETQEAILTLANLGIVSGTADSDGYFFNPDGFVDRMTAVAVIYRVYEKTTEVGDDIPSQTLFTDVTQNIMPAVFNLLVYKGVLSEEDILYSTEENKGLFLLNAMANPTAVQGWLNKAAAELNPAQDYTVTVNVTGGSDTVSYMVNWYQDGKKLPASGNSITVTDTSVSLYYEVVLDDDALKQYSMANGSGAVAFSQGNTTEITVTLASHHTISLNGTVQDENKEPIKDAKVILTQNYSASVSESLSPVTTNDQGKFTISGVKTVPSVLKISAPGYFDYTTAVSLGTEDSGNIDLGTVQLSLLPDSKINLSLSLQAAAVSGQTPTTTPLTSFANLKFDVLKNGSKVTDFVAQYPYLVFGKDSGVGGEDKLTVSVTDTSGKSLAKQQSVEVTLNADGSDLAELSLVENGKIAINELTGTSQATVMIFDNEENLVLSGAAWGAYTSSNLPSGQYTVVALEKSDLIHSVSSLSQLSDFGLTSDNYAQRTATVSNGVITEISSMSVPKLNENAISFTDFASTTVDYSTAAVGRNVTLRVEYQLKEQYENSPVSLTITLPEGLSFKGAPTLNSAVVSSYGSGNTYTISGTGSGVVRVFLTGSKAGSYDISPKLSIAGAAKPVGIAHLDITNAQIYVPSTTGKTDPTVSGISTAEGDVTIYVDGEEQGTVTADKTGVWKTTLSLSDSLYAQHEVYATIEKDGQSYTTETKTLTYDPDYIDVFKVTMYNVVDDREQKVVFDYTDPFSGSNYFTANDSEFTFVITFDEGKDYSRLANVRLNLFAANGDVYTESAEQIGNTNEYTVVTSGVIPVNVGVEYLCRPVEETEQPEQSESIFTEEEYEQYQEIISNIAVGTLEVKTIQQWNDAMAIVMGITGKEDTDFSILVHMDSFPDDTLDSLKEIGFAKINNEKLYLEENEKDSIYLYRMTISKDCIQHIFVTVDAQKNNPALVFTIPIDFAEIVDGLDAHYSGEEISNQNLAGLQDYGELIKDSSINTNLDKSNANLEGSQLDIKIREFPYSNSPGKERWWKSVPVRLLLDFGESGGFIASYTSQLAALCDFPLIRMRLSERIKDIEREVLYLQEKVDQMRKAKDCNGNPVMSEEEYKSLLIRLISLNTQKDLLIAYWNGQLDIFIRNISVSAGVEVVMNKTFRILGAKFADWVLELDSKYDITDTLKRLMIQLGEKGGKLFSKDIWAILQEVPEKTNLYWGLAMNLIGMVYEGTFWREDGSGLATDVEPGDGVLEKIGGYLDIDGTNYHFAIDNDFDDAISEVARMDSDMNRILGNARKNCPPDPLPNHQNDPEKSPCLDKIYGIDPSGYVYEAVPSNRLEGVTAKISKKTGDTYTEWDDAQLYGGQSATIVTPETGEYRWDVPEGTWKVTFAKEDYADKTVEGLDVPPPRTDVNVGLVSTAKPSVESVQAYTDSVLIEFSQYMVIETVEESVTIKVGEEEIPCTVEPLNEETDTNLESNPTYASRFVVTPQGDEKLSGSVSVSINGTAQSYNEKTISPPYNNNNVTVAGERLTGISAPETLGILQGGIAELKFTLQPKLAEEKLQVEIITPSLVQFTDESTAAVTTTEVTTGNDGIATVELKGSLPGKGMVKITHESTGLTKTVNISVVTQADQLSKPGNVTAKSNGKTLSGNDTVTAGAAVTLIESSNAEIRYTLDGTCPKTTAALQYTGPITITKSTTLRAVAVSRNGVFGEVSTWNLTVSGGGTGGGPVGGGENPDEGEETPSLPFTDLDENAWYYPAVQYVFEHEMMLGTSDTAFSPSGKLSRAMVAQILYNLEGRPAVEGTRNFTDVQEGVWWTPAIAWAKENGIVNGYEDNTFQPQKNVTRQEFAKMMYNYAAYKGYDLTADGDLTEYADGGSVSGWAMESMAWANGNQLINGFEDQTLRPLGTATRVQAAQILMNFRENMAA